MKYGGFLFLGTYSEPNARSLRKIILKSWNQFILSKKVIRNMKILEGLFFFGGSIQN